MPGVIRAELCGSVRRRQETVERHRHPGQRRRPGADHGRVRRSCRSVIAGASDSGPTQVERRRSAIAVDGHRIDAERRPARRHRRAVPVRPALLHRQQGAQHRDAAAGHRPRLEAQRVRHSPEGENGHSSAKDEADIFAASAWPTSRRSCARTPARSRRPRRAQLPEAGRSDDIRGVFHNHTTYSDGDATLEEMALAAKELGFEYFGVGDHSQSLTVARGLPPASVRKQWAEIDALNDEARRASASSRGPSATSWRTARSTTPTTCSPAFDYVVASVHTLLQHAGGGHDGPHVQGARPPGGDDARPRDRPAAAAPRGLQDRPGRGAASARPSTGR